MPEAGKNSDNKCTLPEEAVKHIGPDIFDAAGCRHWLLTQLRGQRPLCPVCGVLLSDDLAKRVMDGKSITCRQCGTMSSPRTGTILEGSPLTDRQFYLLLVLVRWGFHPERIAAQVGCGRSTVYEWKKRLAGCA